jgi:hypothetical protein
MFHARSVGILDIHSSVNFQLPVYKDPSIIYLKWSALGIVFCDLCSGSGSNSGEQKCTKISE